MNETTKSKYMTNETLQKEQDWEKEFDKFFSQQWSCEKENTHYPLQKCYAQRIKSFIVAQKSIVCCQDGNWAVLGADEILKPWDILDPELPLRNKLHECPDLIVYQHGLKRYFIPTEREKEEPILTYGLEQLSGEDTPEETEKRDTLLSSRDYGGGGRVDGRDQEVRPVAGDYAQSGAGPDERPPGPSEEEEHTER